MYNNNEKYVSKQVNQKNLNCCTQYLSKQQSTQNEWYYYCCLFSI